MIGPEFLKYLESFGPLGLFFLAWYLDRKSTQEWIQDIKLELKETNKRWYEMGQRIENHLLTNTGTLVDMKGKIKEVTDRVKALDKSIFRKKRIHYPPLLTVTAIMSSKAFEQARGAWSS